VVNAYVADGETGIGVEELQVGGVDRESDGLAGADRAAGGDPGCPQGLAAGQHGDRVVAVGAGPLLGSVAAGATQGLQGTLARAAKLEPVIVRFDVELFLSAVPRSACQLGTAARVFLSRLGTCFTKPPSPPDAPRSA